MRDEHVDGHQTTLVVAGRIEGFKRGDARTERPPPPASPDLAGDDA
jgi:hypothetical protein